MSLVFVWVFESETIHRGYRGHYYSSGGVCYWMSYSRFIHLTFILTKEKRRWLWIETLPAIRNNLVHKRERRRERKGEGGKAERPQPFIQHKHNCFLFWVAPCSLLFSAAARYSRAISFFLERCHEGALECVFPQNVQPKLSLDRGSCLIERCSSIFLLFFLSLG